MDLRERRENAGISLSRLAILTGYDRTYISKVERGIVPASDELLRRCNAALRELEDGSSAMPSGVVISADNTPTGAVKPLPYKDFGPELRRLREAAGLTLRQLAGKVHCHHGTLSNIECGHRNSSRDIAKLCDDVLGANGKLAALLDPIPASASHDAEEALLIGVNVNGAGWFASVNRRTALQTGVALGVASYIHQPVRQWEQDAAQLTQLYERIRSLCQQVSPYFTLPLLVSRSGGILRMAAAGSARSQPLLWSIAAHFAMYTGKMFQEAGDVASAVRWTTTAHSWAGHSGDSGLVAYVLARQAMLAFYTGRADEVIGLAQEAQQITAAPSRVRGMAALREALDTRGRVTKSRVGGRWTGRQTCWQDRMCRCTDRPRSKRPMSPITWRSPQPSAGTTSDIRGTPQRFSTSSWRSCRCMPGGPMSSSERDARWRMPPPGRSTRHVP